ncbi:hypothetical protein [Effusibacillus pohliae]|nr:hypothetical protein [Effusibacillus pohliae]
MEHLTIVYFLACLFCVLVAVLAVLIARGFFYISLHDDDPDESETAER